MKKKLIRLSKHVEDTIKWNLYKDYNQIQNLVRQGKYDEAEAKYNQIKAQQQKRDLCLVYPSLFLNYEMLLTILSTRLWHF